MKVRRGGFSALLAMTGASLLITSTPAAAGFSLHGRTLNLRVPTPNRTSRSDQRVAAWVVSGPRNGTMRGVHAVTGEGVTLGGPDLDTGQVVAIDVTVGRKATQLVLTNAGTVSDLLGALQVGLGPRDEVRPPLDRALPERSGVRVIRVRTFRRTLTEPLPFRTLIQYSKDLSAGEVRVVAAGAEGEAVVTYLITTRNGREVTRQVVQQVVLSQSVDRIEEHGTAEPGAGHGAELGDASWYDWSGCGSGFHAAHKTLPFGTVVTVRNLDNGRAVTVTINDRGPYLPGRIIDLCPTAFSAIAPLGQGIAHVQITW